MKPHGYWNPLKEKVLAMQPNDLVVWPVTRPELDTALKRTQELRTSEFKTACNFLDNKLFIVRMR